MARRFFYGWFLVGIAWVLYGFGMSPAYYSWGFFTPEIIEELGLTRAQMGYVFGLFTFIFSGVAPLTGVAMNRWGIRAVLSAGAATAALGFLLVSRMDSLHEAILYYAILGGIGVGLSTVLPAQTIATNWFVKYRARAVAIILIAGGVVGRLVTRFDRAMIESFSWRTGWVVIAAVSASLAVLAAVFVRNSPEDLGQLPDGREASDRPDSVSGESEPTPEAEPIWAAADAIRTPQFALLCMAAMGYALPWVVVVQHGRLHLQDLGFSTQIAAGILGTMILVSIVGRLSGSLGDFVKPQVVYGCALALEGLGVLGLLGATTPATAGAATVAIGLGFGAAFISSPLVFASFFGRRAFATINGTRLLIVGIFSAVAPGIAGAVFDRTGTYTSAFVGLIVISAVGSIAALICKSPVQKTVHGAAAAHR